MDQTRHFAAAPWPTYLKLSSTLGTILMAGAGIAAYRAIPVPAGFTHYFGLVIALVLPVSLLLALLFTVTGYVVAPGELYVQRLMWATRISLEGLERVWIEPGICKKSIRLMGNGGLFGFTGLYRNSRLGRYRLYATDISHAVVLGFPARTVVITPDLAETFVEHIHRVIPGARKAAQAGG